MSSDRPDINIIGEWIEPNSTVLDLGCGDGALLFSLGQSHNVMSYGIEMDLDNIDECIKKGINVIRMDIDDGLSSFENQAFDYVVIAHTIQSLYHPVPLLRDMLRVGKNVIVTFPNYGHLSNRIRLAINGRAPLSDVLPYDWYDTPNIHLCSVTDFTDLCGNMNVYIANKLIVNRSYNVNLAIRLFPNMFGEIALLHLKS